MALTLVDLYRTPVYSIRGKRVGKVADVLFHPRDAAAVGFLVQRPRFLFILDRKDRHLALDRSAPSRAEIDVTDEKDAWDKKAEKRLGLDWEHTVVWSGMPVRTAGGTVLGRVGDVEFDERTGGVISLALTGGTTADLAVGRRVVEGTLVSGYRDDAVIVADAAAEVELAGGAATVAGRASAVAKKHAGEAAVAAGVAAKQAVTAGKAAARAAAQSQTGKKAIGWLKSMRDELADAMGDPDDDK